MKILAICTDRDLLDTILRLLQQKPEWKSEGAISADEAISIFRDNPCDIVLLGSGLNDDTEKHLTDTFTRQKPDVKIVQHFGGGSGLLFNEIMQVMERN